MASNEEVLRKWVGIAAAGEFERIPEVWAADMTLHAGDLGEANGIDEMLALFGKVASAFPDMGVEIAQLVSEGDRIAALYWFTGTHEGDYFGVAPTGKKMKVMAWGLYRIADEKIAEAWAFDDTLSMLIQLGALPVNNG